MITKVAGGGHDVVKSFWDRAWALYRRYGVPIGYARRREASYRKESVAAHRRSVTPRAPGSIAGQRPSPPASVATPQDARTGLSRSPVNTRIENPGAAREEILD